MEKPGRNRGCDSRENRGLFLLLSADSADHDLVMRPWSVLLPGRDGDEVHGLSEFYLASLLCSSLVVCTLDDQMANGSDRVGLSYVKSSESTVLSLIVLDNSLPREGAIACWGEISRKLRVSCQSMHYSGHWAKLCF